MASSSFGTYVWRQGDDLRRVAATQSGIAGYDEASLGLFTEAIRYANLPTRVPSGVRGRTNWYTVTPGVVIIIPHKS